MSLVDDVGDEMIGAPPITIVRTYDQLPLKLLAAIAWTQMLYLLLFTALDGVTLVGTFPDNPPESSRAPGAASQ